MRYGQIMHFTKKKGKLLGVESGYDGRGQGQLKILPQCYIPRRCADLDVKLGEAHLSLCAITNATVQGLVGFFAIFKIIGQTLCTRF